MFVAVGDEGRQRVDVMGVLHHGDFIGLLAKEKQEKKRHEPLISRRLTMQQVSIKAETSVLPSPTLYTFTRSLLAIVQNKRTE